MQHAGQVYLQTLRLRGVDETVLLAGGSDLARLPHEVAAALSQMMHEQCSPSFQVVWVPDILPSGTQREDLDALQMAVREQILRQAPRPTRDVKLSFVLGSMLPFFDGVGSRN